MARTSVQSNKLSEDTKKDLKFMLDRNRRGIVYQYASYCRCISQSIKEKNISVKDFCAYLTSLEALESSNDVQCRLLTEIRTELEEAKSTHDLLALVNKYCTSFMNIGILEHIVEEYDLDKGQNKMKYPQYLLEYINKHKIKEFAEMNPELVKSAEKLKIIGLKLDIAATSKLTKIIDVQDAVARILDLKPSALQLYSIEDGCVVANFHLPTRVAEIIFTRRKKFSPVEQKEFISLSVLWLEYEDMKFYFSKVLEGKAKAKFTTSGKHCMHML